MKTYEIIIKEAVKWEVEVTANNYKEAVDKAYREVADNEWNHFEMVGGINFYVAAKRIKSNG